MQCLILPAAVIYAGVITILDPCFLPWPCAALKSCEDAEPVFASSTTSAWLACVQHQQQQPNTSHISLDSGAAAHAETCKGALFGVASSEHLR